MTHQLPEVNALACQSSEPIPLLEAQELTYADHGLLCIRRAWLWAETGGAGNASPSVVRWEHTFRLAMFLMICGWALGTVADTKSMPSPGMLGAFPVQRHTLIWELRGNDAHGA